MKKRLFDRLVESMEQHKEIHRGIRAHSCEKVIDAVGVRAELRLAEDEEKLPENRQTELRAAIREGVDSEDAGSIEEVVTKNRARRAGRKASKT